MNLSCDVSLRELAAHEAIRQGLYRYCRGADRRDPVMMASAYWPDAVDHRNEQGIPAWIDQAMKVVDSFERLQHRILNVLIELDGNTARTEAYYDVYHRIKIDAGECKDEFLAGRFIDRWECRGNEWRIIERRPVIDWLRVEPGQDPQGKGYRGRGYGGGPDDPSFKLFPLEA